MSILGIPLADRSPTLVEYYDPNYNANAYTYLYNQAWAKISDVVLTLHVSPITAVPEPATYGMLLGGLALVGFAAHRRSALPK